MSINFAKRRYTCFEADPEVRRQLAEQLRKQSFLGRHQRVAEADSASRRRALMRQLEEARGYAQKTTKQSQQQEQEEDLHRVRTQDVDKEFSFSCLGATASSSLSRQLEWQDEEYHPPLQQKEQQQKGQTQRAESFSRVRTQDVENQFSCTGAAAALTSLNAFEMISSSSSPSSGNHRHHHHQLAASTTRSSKGTARDPLREMLRPVDELLESLGFYD
eukprot:scaffold1982_cov93-Amphora_coffeaeformis.AAC.59